MPGTTDDTLQLGSLLGEAWILACGYQMCRESTPKIKLCRSYCRVDGSATDWIDFETSTVNVPGSELVTHEERLICFLVSQLTMSLKDKYGSIFAPCSEAGSCYITHKT
jgi:hypothetical protein